VKRVVLLICVSLVGCGGYLTYNQFYQKSFNIKRYSEGEVEVNEKPITVIINYYTPKEIEEQYKNLGGKANGVIAYSHNIKDVCIIGLVKPKGWNDHRALTLLGHEILHCQGGKHN
jgi:hypothetical protein